MYQCIRKCLFVKTALLYTLMLEKQTISHTQILKYVTNRLTQFLDARHLALITHRRSAALKYLNILGASAKITL